MTRPPTIRFSPKKRRPIPNKARPVVDHTCNKSQQHDEEDDDPELARLLALLTRPKRYLLDLPETILKVIFVHVLADSRWSLAQFCRASKAAALAAQPVLFSRLSVPSFASLPHLFKTLRCRPDLASHVVELAAAENFLSGEPFFLVDSALNTCRVGAGSNILSMELVRKFVDSHILEAMPIPWLVRIATICPLLRSIDLSHAGTTPWSAPSILLGILDLVKLLKYRRGRFVTPYQVPITALVVKDKVMFVERTTGRLDNWDWNHDLYWITGTIDWGKKQMDVSNLVTDVDSPFASKHMALIPFSDLVSPSPTDQERWTIRNVTCQLLYEQEHDVRPWHAEGWIRSAKDLWARIGFRLGKDRVFDFAKQGTVVGNIKYSSAFSDFVWTALNARPCFGGLDRVNELVLESSGPEHYVALRPSQLPRVCTQHMQATTDLLCPSSSALAFRSLSQLSISGGFAFRPNNCAPVFRKFAASLPNLVDLSISSILCELDAILIPLDCLIRRRPALGKPLQCLRLTAYVSPNTSNPLVTTSATYGQIASGMDEHSENRTLLCQTAPTRSHLRRLELKVDGPRSVRVPSPDMPTAAIHPGLLHGIERLDLWAFKLFVLPPCFAAPDGPSFLPLAYLEAVTRASPLTDRTLLNLCHLTLPSLRTLHLSAKCILGNAFPPSVPEQDQFHRLAPLLPTCPQLERFVIRTDYAGVAFTGQHVVAMLARFPRLVFAQFGCTKLTARQLEWLVDGVVNGVPERKHRLRDLELYNIKAADPADRGWIVSGPHVSHLAEEQVLLGPALVPPAAFAPTSVELDPAVAKHLGPADPLDTRCSRCDRVVKSIGGFLELDANREYSSDHGIYPFHDLNLTQEPVSRCPKCAPQRQFFRFGKVSKDGARSDGIYMWKCGMEFPMVF